ncbi:MAG TPA: hypothetical protein VNO54_12840 [Streptosporangiaceae bacterium]|nr:hypothetical protein [Streptosporangiaceae bacterium]
MKTRPGRPRGFTRLARALGLDRNPLRRATDRAEAWIRVGLLAVFLIAGPMAALSAGHWAYHAGITAAQVPAAPTHRVKPASLWQARVITDLPRVGQGGRAWAGAPGESTGRSARAGEVLVAVMTLAAVALVLLAVLRLALAFLSGRRLAAWETAWSRVGPQWSKRRP